LIGAFAVTGCAQNPHLSGGRLYRSQKVYDKAQRELELAVQQEPNNPLAHLELGMVYAEIGETKKAGEEFEKTLQLDPKKQKDVDANRQHYWVEHFNAGIRLSNEEQNFAEAAKEFQKAVDLDPKDVRAYTNLAFCLRKIGQVDEALALFQQALILNPTDANARRNLAASYLDMARSEAREKRYVEAIMLYEKAAELDTTLTDTQFELANAYSEAALAESIAVARSQYYDKAVSLYLRVLEREPDNIDATFNLGTAYLAMDKLDEALPLLQRAVNMDPKAFDFHYRLGRAYARAENVEMAAAEIVMSKALQTGTAQTDLDAWFGGEAMKARYPDVTAQNKALQANGRPEQVFTYDESGVAVEVWFYWTKGLGLYFVNGSAPAISKVEFAPVASQ
jgi:tetratricopeptide (TPR) repeat protein